MPFCFCEFTGWSNVGGVNNRRAYLVWVVAFSALSLELPKILLLFSCELIPIMQSVHPICYLNILYIPARMLLLQSGSSKINKKKTAAVRSSSAQFEIWTNHSFGFTTALQYVYIRQRNSTKQKHKKIKRKQIVKRLFTTNETVQPTPEYFWLVATFAMSCDPIFFSTKTKNKQRNLVVHSQTPKNDHVTKLRFYLEL